MSATTTTQISAEVNNFYNRTLLMRATPLLVHSKFAQVKDIPANSGTQTIKFRKYSSLTAATTALTEGVTPVGSSLSISDITAVVAQYGDFVTVTDVVQYQSQDAVLTETAELLGEQSGLTFDTLARNVYHAGTNVYYGGSATTRLTTASTDLITTTLIDKVVRLLKNNKARKVTRMINATDGYATDPVAACYIGIVHPNITYTLQGLTGFTPVEKYPSQQGVMDGEVGKYKEVRFIETTEAKVFSAAGAAGIDIYSTLIFGQDAFGVTRISGKSLENIVKPLGSGGSADPLNQRATSGWKGTFVAKIVNNDNVIRVETAAAA